MPPVTYEVTPLRVTQSSTECSVITLELIDYFLHSATPSRTGIEECIRRGGEIYADMMNKNAFDIDDGRTYVSTPEAYEVMRQSPWSRLANVEQGEDVVGMHLPAITEFNGMTHDNSLPRVVMNTLHPAPGDVSLRFLRSLEDGLSEFSRRAQAQPIGQALAASLTVGSRAGGHTITLAAYYLGANEGMRYHAVETMSCDPRTGLYQEGSTTAAWITADIDAGIREYIRDAFPPCANYMTMMQLYELDNDDDGVEERLRTLKMAPFMYSITTFERRHRLPAESNSNSNVATFAQRRITQACDVPDVFSLITLAV
jgi:hypothetical protein